MLVLNSNFAIHTHFYLYLNLALFWQDGRHGGKLSIALRGRFFGPESHISVENTARHTEVPKVFIIFAHFQNSVLPDVDADEVRPLEYIVTAREHSGICYKEVLKCYRSKNFSHF